MDRDEKVAVLFTENGKGEIRKSEITQEELGKIFFGEGNRNWDHVHLALPEPVWERIYEDHDGVFTVTPEKKYDHSLQSDMTGN